MTYCGITADVSLQIISRGLGGCLRYRAMPVICVFLIKLVDSTEALIASVKSKEVLNQKSPLLVKNIKWNHRLKSNLWNEYCLNGQFTQSLEIVVQLGICLTQVFQSNGHKIADFTRDEDIQQAIEKSMSQIMYHTERIRRLKIMQQYIGQSNKDHPSSDEHSTSNCSGQTKQTSVEARQLESYYRLLQADLKRTPVKFIQTAYKDHQRGKIVVDIKEGKYEATCKALQHLQHSSEYYDSLDVVECEPGELLMQAGHLSNLECDLPRLGHPQYNTRIGNGSQIGCISVNDLQGLINDKDMKSISDIQKKYPSTSRGTLTCIVKHKAKYYTMTAQHVLDKQQFSSNQKQIFSQVHYECPDLLLADIVHLSSCYSGQMDTIPVNDTDKAVDVALMPISQSHLDETRLVQIPVYCRNNFENETHESDTVLLNKRVRKTGAITGENEGKIISTDCLAPLDPDNDDSPQGQMFAVVGLSNTTQPFAEQGDSGSLVTIQLKQNGRNYKYALGIIAQLRRRLLGRTNVALCVRMEDCLKSLESATGLSEAIDSTALELYVGFLRPFAALHDRTMAHVEVDNTSATGGAAG